MKRLLSVLLFIPIIGFSQSFVLTPSGLRDAQDSNKSYVVIEVPNKTAKQLYEKSMNFLREYYKNPDKVIKSTIDSEMIRFEGYQGNLSTIDFGVLVKYKFPLNSSYSIELKFKDGKIKYEILQMGLTIPLQNGDHPFGLVQPKGTWNSDNVWNRKGELAHPQTKSDIENSFNARVLGLKEYLTNEKKKDSW